MSQENKSVIFIKTNVQIFYHGKQNISCVKEKEKTFFLNIYITI